MKKKIMIVIYYLAAFVFLVLGKTNFQGANEFLAYSFSIVNFVLGTILLLRYIKNRE